MEAAQAVCSLSPGPDPAADGAGEPGPRGPRTAGRCSGLPGSAGGCARPPAAWCPWWGSAGPIHHLQAEFVTGNKAVNCAELLMSAGARAGMLTGPAGSHTPAEGGARGSAGLQGSMVGRDLRGWR